MDEFLLRFDQELGQEVSVPNPEFEAEKERVHREKAYTTAGIPESRFNLSFDSYIGEKSKGNLKSLEFFITNFEKACRSKANLYFWGGNSTQKSSVATVMGMRLIDAGHSVRFITFSELTDHLQNEQFNEDSRDLINNLYKVELLIVDDAFDLKKTKMYKSGHQIPFLDSFFRRKLETTNTLTLFTSNTRLEDLEAQFNTDINHLLRRNVRALHFQDDVNYFEIDNDFWSEE